MKLTDIVPGQAVRVRRGYSTRPATVDRVTTAHVHVTFTDIVPGMRDIVHRSYMYGAAVRPAQVLPGCGCQDSWLPENLCAAHQVAWYGDTV